MRTIRLEEWKKLTRTRQFEQISRLVCLFATVLFVCAYGFLIFQRMRALEEKMSDGADLLALRVQDRLSSVQGTSMYLASLNNINSLLVQENPSLRYFSEYDDVLRSVAGSDITVELMFHKSQKVLISDYGLSDYSEYFDQAFLQELLQHSPHERWMLRSYRQNIYTGARNVISYVRSLPLSSVQNKGYLVVSQSLSAIAKTAATYAEEGLGDYAVWLEDMVLASSSEVSGMDTAHSCLSQVETQARAAYWMPLGAMMMRSVPRPLMSLLIYAAVMLLCLLASRMICSQRMAQLDGLVQEMGGDMEGAYDDQVDQLYRIFESLTSELTHARQTTREGLPLLQERLIGELLRTHVPIAQRRESLDKCGIELKHPYFAVVQVAPQSEPFDGQTYLLVRRNVQTQLAALGEVHSTYGDGSSILFLLNAPEYEALDEKLEALCETMHDALMSFLSVDVLFAIGLCPRDNPSPNYAYTAARERLSALRMLEEQPPEAVVLAHSSQQAYLHRDVVQAVCDAVVSQDAAALEQALEYVRERYLTPELTLKESIKRAQVFVLRTGAALMEADFHASLEDHAALRHLKQRETEQEIWQAAAEWCRALIDASTGENEENNRYVEQALAFIHSHYMHTLNVPEIAEAVNINPIYLNRLFKSSTGSTISNYLSQYRCEHARAMLENTQATVNEISDACGFSEVRSFIRFFKKYYGQTPTEYRKRAKQ